ncbi:ABC transporter substrate-binding protein [Mangrovimonas sp. CR14]|uniref:type IX secretion system anionic LPS delivery protein PorZ n=1 Tax=Mangrovimonas sp. CR14 TaxID=2706120 RepID=UPI0014241963|nr:two-component regulator propeller domain-containing protein [Mangrovimonas sp. CR14]NIK91059.1 ABC transporter substrate-binding protein [Mangrovimonas sp. CR14]
MIRKVLLIVYLLISGFVSGQDYSSLWKGHYSYFNIQDISQGNGKIYAAAENAIFSYDTTTSELETIDTVNGLSGESISAIYYSEAYMMLLVGYENGLIDIVMEDGNILSVVDILDKPTIPPNTKRINHFKENEGIVYISTDYGISVYDLLALEFGDTYYIGTGGAQIPIKQTALHGGFIYAACQNNNGLKRALASSNDLIDYQQWSNITGGNFLGVQDISDQLYAVRNNRELSRVQNGMLIPLTNYQDQLLSMKSVSESLIIATQNEVFVYDASFNQLGYVHVNQTEANTFTSATVKDGFIYIGTGNIGMLKTALTDATIFETIYPDGPLRNGAFSIQARQNNLWMTYGDYTLSYNPAPLRFHGISHLNGESWVNIPYSEVLGAINLNKMAINPFNVGQVFISSFFDGILEINDDVPTILYDESNSGLESLILPNNPNYKNIRQSASIFDSNGILWTLTARVAKPLKSYDPTTQQWQGYSFGTLFSADEALNAEFGYSDIELDANGNKWIGGYLLGLIGYSSNGTLKNMASEEENLPSPFITSLAVDKQNQVWVGNYKGLRVLYNTTGFFDGSVSQLESIIILEDGVPKELLYEQYVTDIEVDGANNKWIGTFSSGLFYLSSNGQETIYHFTKKNSPLPSNNIVDISIDESNGTVYIATANGLVSFSSGGSETTSDFENSFVFPNPVRPEFNINNDKVKIRGLPENVNIKILDIEGNLVAEAKSNVNMRYRGYNLEIDGGTAFWNGRNLGNNTVASGVYLIMLSDLDTYETKVLKLMVVR